MSKGTPGIPYWRLSSFYFVYYLVLGTMMPYWSLYLDALGVSPSGIAATFAVMSATRIIGPNLWGWLADRSGHRLSIIRGASVAATVSFGAILVVRDAVWIAVVMCVHTLFWNAILAQYEVITLNSLKENHSRYGQVRLWGSVSFVLAVWGFGALFDVLDMLMFPFLLLGILALVALTSFSIQDPGAGEVHEQHGSIWPVLRRSDVAAFMLGCFLLQVSHGTYYTFFSLYVEDLGYSRTQTGLLWAVGVIAEIAVFAWMHRLRARFDLRTLLLLSVALTLVRWILTATLASSLVVLLFAQSLHAFSYGSFHGAGIEYVRRRFGGRHQGQGQALYSAVSFGAGSAVGALISGSVWEQGAQLAFWLSAFAALLCWFILARWVHDDAYPPTLTKGSPL